MVDLERRVWLATGVSVALFAAYETIKTVAFPHISIVTSHVITVFVVGFLSFFISRYVLNRHNEVMEENLREAARTEQTNRLLTGLLSTMREGVLIVDSDKRVVLYNRAAQRIVRLPESDSSMGRSSDSVRLVDTTRDPAINEAFRCALSEKRPSEVRVELAGADGRIFHLSVAPLGRDLAMGVFFDISRLEQLEKVRREFFANLSHELRTPLTAILANSETLLEGAIDDAENRLRFVERLHKHAARMSELVSDISDLSAIESGTIKLELEPFRLKTAVLDVIVLLEARRAGASVTVTVDVDDQTMVRADRTRIGQILYNLIDNAVKFNRPGGEVRVKAHREGELMNISVEDTGIGIAASDLPRVFERLYRADRSRSRRTEGTGLGLAIVKHLVQAHGGEVSV